MYSVPAAPRFRATLKEPAQLTTGDLSAGMPAAPPAARRGDCDCYGCAVHCSARRNLAADAVVLLFVIVPSTADARSVGRTPKRGDPKKGTLLFFFLADRKE